MSRQISLPGPSILPETHFQTGSKNPGPLRLTPDLHLADHAVFVVDLQILFGPADLAFQLSLSNTGPTDFGPRHPARARVIWAECPIFKRGSSTEVMRKLVACEGLELL